MATGSAPSGRGAVASDAGSHRQRGGVPIQRPLTNPSTSHGRRPQPMPKERADGIGVDRSSPRQSKDLLQIQEGRYGALGPSGGVTYYGIRAYVAFYNI
jgi:hypothetical protein